MSNPSFLPARAKLWIASIDNPKLEVRAQYNPKELQIDKQVPWQEHKARDNRSGRARDERSKQGDLEFNGAPTRSMTLELLFDCYESFHDDASVEPDVRTLEALSSVRDPEARDPELRRPHHCLVVWGASKAGMRPFCCVIESLSVKYTMWDHAGTPKRATCTVKLKEANRLSRSGSLEKMDLGEKRRSPGWDRENPAAQDSLSAEAYMEQLAAAMRRPAPKLKGPEGDR